MRPLRPYAGVAALVFPALMGAAEAGAGDFTEKLIAPAPRTEVQSAWDIQFRPYLWTADIEGRAGAGENISAVDVSFSDLFDTLDLAWASTLDIRRRGQPWGFFLDTFYMKLDPDVTAPISDVNVEQAIIDPVLTFRLYEWDRGWFELIGGLRWSYMKTEIDTVVGVSASNSESWFDPHVGVRLRHYLNDRWYTGGAMDFGGFGIGADLAVQLVGGVGYHFTDWFAVETFYRYYSVDYEEDGFLWDTDTFGLFLGAAFYF